MLLLSYLGAWQLFEFDQDLVEFHSFPWRYFYRLHLSRNRCCDAGFHFHGFQNHEQIVRLQLISGLHADSHYDSGHGTATHFRLVGIPFRRRVGPLRRGHSTGLGQPRRMLGCKVLSTLDIDLNLVGLPAHHDLDLQGRLRTIAFFGEPIASCPVPIGGFMICRFTVSASARRSCAKPGLQRAPAVPTDWRRRRMLAGFSPSESGLFCRARQ